MSERLRNSVGRATAASLCLLVVGVACQSAYYRTLEQFGYEKRHILRDRVEDARSDQRKAHKQFQTTYERFKEVANIDGGELEDTYKRLNKAFGRSEARAATVGKRIRSIEQVAADLFGEWEADLAEIDNTSLRTSSRQSLATTRLRYSELIGALQRVEQKMTPVLTAFRDRVLFLKHNLNAQALAALDGAGDEIRAEVAALLQAMDNSIQEADRFLVALER